MKDGDAKSDDGNGGKAKDPFIGLVLDKKYRVDSVLGRGGMGTVYLAQHLLMDRQVALKVLHAHLVEDEEFLKRFRHEAKVASRLRHKNAVTIYDFGVHESRPYLVMEFAPGRTLKDLIQSKGALLPGEITPLLLPITSALAEAHRLGIVHRDLKPENILLGQDGDSGDDGVRILDFGIAKMVQSDPSTATIATRAGMFFGTPGYAAPEQVLGKELDTRSDIYALGIILYEALSGSTPFSSPSMMELLMMHVNVVPKSLLGKLPDLSPEVDAVVLRCLEKDRDKRYQNMHELFAAFDAAAKKSGASPVKRKDGPGPKFSLSREHKAIIAIVLLMFALYSVSKDSSKKKEGGEGESEVQVSTTTTITTPPATSAKRDPATSSTTSTTSTGSTGSTGAAPTTSATVSTTVTTMRPAEIIPTPTTATTSSIWSMFTSTTISDFGGTTITMPGYPIPTLPSALPSVQPSIQPPLEPPVVKNAEESFQTGFGLYAAKRYAEAIPELEAAIRSNPQHLRAHLALGTCYLRMGRTEDAKREYLSAAAIDPGFAAPHFELACLYAVSGMTNEAINSLEAAIRLDKSVKGWVRSEEDLASLRNDPRYQRLMAEEKPVAKRRRGSAVNQTIDQVGRDVRRWLGF